MNRQFTLFPLDNPPLIPLHTRENNSVSQKNLEENKEHFAGQNKTIYDALMKGEIINSDTAKDVYHVRHLARRIANILEAGFQLSKQPIPGAHGMLNHFMTKEQREFNLSKEREGER